MSLSVKAFFFSSWPPAENRTSSEIRRFAVDDGASSSLTYLMHKIASVFQLKRADNLVVRWRDEDGDYIDIKTDEDLMEALSAGVGDVLRIYVSLSSSTNGSSPPTAGQQAPGSDDPLHPHVICDACEGEVRGSRFKCTTCYDYDLCAFCERRGLHAEHLLLRIRQPARYGGEGPFGFGGVFGFGSGNYGSSWGGFGGGGKCGGRPRGHCGGRAKAKGCGRFSSSGGCPRRAPSGEAQAGCSTQSTAGSNPCGGGTGTSGCSSASSGTGTCDPASWMFGITPDQVASFASEFLQRMGGPQQQQQQQEQPQQQQQKQQGEDQQTQEKPASSGEGKDRQYPSSAAAEAMSSEDPYQSGHSYAADSDERRYQECMERLLEFGFSDDGGWLQNVVQECNGEVSTVLDRIEAMYKQHHA